MMVEFTRRSDRNHPTGGKHLAGGQLTDRHFTELLRNMRSILTYIYWDQLPTIFKYLRTSKCILQIYCFKQFILFNIIYVQ